MLLSLCVTALFIQDPGSGEKQPAAPAVQEATWSEWDDKTTRAELKVFKEKMKGRRVPLAQRTEAVEALAKGSNKKLVTPLVKVVVTDKAVTVRRTAAEALAHQPSKDARRAVLKLLENDKVKDSPPVMAALIDSLRQCGYVTRDWDKIDSMFERDYAAERLPLQQAILRLVTQHKEKQAVDMLVRNLGEPAPEDVDSPNNPPASYWEARWKAWQAWRDDVKGALFEITGQRFSTPKEARAWLKKNGKKIGIK